MERKDLHKEAVSVVSLQKEVQALKEAVEVNSLKEHIIANILTVQDKAKLTEIESQVRDILYPKRPGPGSEGIASSEQGNG
jgi:hypothetical protein